MFKFKEKEIKNNTSRIARGTYMLSTMPNEEFISLYKKMKEKRMNTKAKYKLPDWFTIIFKSTENNTHKFIGSFTDGNGYPLVYKKDLLKILKKLKVKYEQIDEDTYKIIRNNTK